MKSKFNFILTLFLAFIVQLASAQEKEISGVVSDAVGPMLGVNIVKKGTDQGVDTDMEGRYSISAKKGDVLIFSFMGYDEVEKEVGSSTKINVSLKESSNVLPTVVVTGIVSQTKESLTGSVVEVKEKELAQVVSANVVKGLTGKVAGVQIYSGSGKPGAAPTVRFRGIGSLTGSSNPLYVVDGVPFNGNITSINQNDIASINFVKDASATALYGSRGANGVIVITTKKGKSGSVSVNFDFKTSFTERAMEDYSYIKNSEKFVTNYHKFLKNSAISKGKTEKEAGQLASKDLFDGKLGLVYNPFGGDRTAVVSPDGDFNGGESMWNGNWNDVLFRKGIIKTAYVGVSGGNDNTRYFMSVGNEANDAYVVGNEFKRTTAKTNISSELFKGFDMNVGLNYTNRKNVGAPNENNALYGPFGFVRSMPSIYPVYAVDHSTGELFLDSKGNKQWDNEAVISPNATGGRPLNPFTNPVATPILNKSVNTSENFTTRGGVSYKFFDGFKFNYNVGFDINKYESLVAQSNKIGSAIETNGRLTRRYDGTQTFTNQQILSYKKNIGYHKLDFMIGHESFNKQDNYLKTTQIDQFVSNDFTPSLYGKPDGAEAIKGKPIYYTLEGYLARVMYDYNSKYYVNFSFRRDGSSVFHPDNRWGNFYGGGFAWRISQEKFMSNVSWIDELKLKSSFGQLGNDVVYYDDSSNPPNRNYAPYLDQWTVTRNGKGFELAKNTLGNKKITWEKTTNINAGFEAAFFDRRLRIESEYFIRKVTDMLYNRPLPASTGLPSVPENVMSMENKGVEFSLGYDFVRNDNLNWSVSLNATHYKNEITSLVPGKDHIDASGSRRWKVGYGAYDYYMREFKGVNSKNGNAQFYLEDQKDADGNLTNNLTEDYSAATLKMIGKTSLPDVYGGLSTKIDYKRFDFSLDFAYQLGGHVYDSTYIDYFKGKKAHNLHTDFDKTWSFDNKEAKLPAIIDGGKNYDKSSLGLKSADYLSINNLAFGYTIPAEQLSSLGGVSVRIYGNINNLALFTKDGTAGFDPRMSLTTVNAAQYAPLRTYSLGVNIKL